MRFFSSVCAGDGGHCAASEATGSSGRAGFGPSLNPGQCVVIAGNEVKAPADLRASVRQQHHHHRCTFQYGMHKQPAAPRPRQASCISDCDMAYAE